MRIAIYNHMNDSITILENNRYELFSAVLKGRDITMPKSKTIIRKIRYHPLIDLLFTLKGNPRVCVFIEPLWGIPHYLIAPFTALYMTALGVSKLQIGIALSIALFAQIPCAFFGGIIADKLGRKRATMLGDFIGWVVPCAIWACAQNYWFFLAAMVFNSFEQINQTAWVCLLVEDAPEKDILNIWNLILIAGLLAVFVSPISGALLLRFSLIPIMRFLYAFFSINMLIKCFITYKYTTETEQGRKRKLETKGVNPLELIPGNLRLIPEIFRNHGTLCTLIIMVITNVTLMISSNFYSIYATENLGIPENRLAYLPIIRACIMLLFFFIIQHKLAKFRTKGPLSTGLAIYICNQLLLILSPQNTIIPLIIYTFLDAVAFALVYPRKELMTAVLVDKQERARIVAILTTLMIGFAIPFGFISGWLAKQDGRFPFILNLGFYLLAFVVIRSMRANPGAEDENESPADAIAESST